MDGSALTIDRQSIELVGKNDTTRDREMETSALGEVNAVDRSNRMDVG